MANKKEKQPKIHHLGSPEFAYECAYNKNNMEYGILFRANGSNTHFLGEHVKMNDELYLGLSEESFESLLESMISAVSDRLKDKLERYNNYKKEFYMKELEGNESDWDKNEAWNSFSKLSK